MVGSRFRCTGAASPSRAGVWSSSERVSALIFWRQHLHDAPSARANDSVDWARATFFWVPRAAAYRPRAATPLYTVRVLMTSVIEMPGDAVAATASGHKYRYVIHSKAV